MGDKLKVLPYSEVPKEYKWNAESVFETKEAWEAGLSAIEAKLPEIEKFKGHLGDSPAVLADWFDFAEDLQQNAGKLMVYASMTYNVDTTNQGAMAMMGRLQALWGRLAGMMAFSDPELLAIGKEKLDAWIVKEPRLHILAHYIDDLFRQQEHVRSAEVEEVLGMLASPFRSPYNTYNALNSTDLTFKPAINKDGEEVEITQSTFDALMESPDRQLRQSAWENYADSYLAFKNTFASNFAANVQQNVFRSRARRYESSLDAALFQNNIPTSVFHNLIDTFKKRLPVWHRYWALRSKALGIDIHHPFDVWAPLTDHNHEISWEEAVDMICNGLAPLGEAYVSALRNGCLENRWVDRYPNLGKQQGAYSSGVKGTMPFIKMSFTNSLESMSTLSHELGHSMHSYLTWENQPGIYSWYGIFLAEIASNFNQAMTRAWLLENHPDPHFQIAVILEAMSNFHRYFFLMPTLAQFELEAHRMVEKGQGLTADGLNKLMADLFAEGYGDTMYLDRDRVGIIWAEFQHTYMNFYVYQYATGISGAHAFAKRILDGEPGAAEKYLGFLKAGSSAYALDTLKKAGLDLSTPDPVEAAFDVMEGYINKLEKLVEQIS